MRRFLVLLRKELHELLTLQMLLPLALTVVMFALVGNLIGGQTGGGAYATVKLVDADHTAASALVKDALVEAGFIVLSAPGGDPAAAAAADRGIGTGVIIGVPAGFEAGLKAGTPQRLETYTVLRNFSFLATRDATVLKTALDAVNVRISQSLIASRIGSADAAAAMREPVGLAENVVIGTRSAAATAQQITGFVTSQTTFIPIVLFIVIMFASSMIASTVASEKENKTLETLLATPAARGSLVLAKMSAAALIAFASSAAYLFGMRTYVDKVSAEFGTGAQAAGAGMGSAIQRLGLSMSVGDYLLLFASLFCGILVALAISVILGAFAENVRSVQALLTPLTVAVMIPYFLTLFIDLDATTPLVRTLVLAIPFAHPFRAAPAILMHDYLGVWLGIGYELVWFAAAVLVATRIFSSDRILTLRLGRRRRAKLERG
jgi:ABC-2 type transport system permease protein